MTQKTVEDIVARVEEQHNRRREDRFFDVWIRPILHWVLISIVGAAIGMWIKVILIDNDVARIKIEQITQDAKLQSLMEQKEAVKNLEVVMGVRLSAIEDRMTEQTKRMTMQGEGLVSGNETIHQVLQRLIGMSERMERIERDFYSRPRDSIKR